jgi:hypothetical protein
MSMERSLGSWASLEPGQTARETVLFVMGANYEEAHSRLRSAREQFATLDGTGSGGGRETAAGNGLDRERVHRFRVARPGTLFLGGHPTEFPGSRGRTIEPVWLVCAL